MLTDTIAFIGAPGPWEMMIIGMIALLLFGKRLPEVARSLGKGLVEFKKGVKGIEDDVERSTYVDDDTIRWQSTNREIAGDLQPNIPEVTVVRHKAEAKEESK